MIPLSIVKEELGISLDADGIADTSNDAMLNRAIRQVQALVRQRTNRWIIGVGTLLGSGSALTVTCPDHGLVPTSKVRLRCDSGSIDANYVVATTTRDTFTVPSAVTVATALDCSVHPYRSTWAHGSGVYDLFLPTTLLPIHELIVVQVAELDVEFTMENHSGDPKVQRIRRVDECIWQKEVNYHGSSMAFSVKRNSAEKSVLLEGYVGLRYLPADLEMAVLSLISDIAEREGTGKDVASESFEGVSRSRLSGDERKQQLLSADRVLQNWKGC